MNQEEVRALVQTVKRAARGGQRLTDADMHYIVERALSAGKRRAEICDAMYDAFTFCLAKHRTWWGLGE